MSGIVWLLALAAIADVVVMAGALLRRGVVR